MANLKVKIKKLQVLRN